jgi:hypothetical protein
LSDWVKRGIQGLFGDDGSEALTVSSVSAVAGSLIVNSAAVCSRMRA